jgi:aldehyde dehydrogenase
VSSVFRRGAGTSLAPRADAVHASSGTSQIKQRYDNFIGGAWVAPVGGEYFDNITPITGHPICQVARSRAADIELALDAAHKAKNAWGKTSATERANILNKIADRLESNLPPSALVESIDNGKPIRETTAADLPLAIDHFRYFAGCVRAQEGSISEIDHDMVAYHFNEPLGVVGQIIPWNFPILMAVWKLAPALAAGNCVVLEPAEQTPMSILLVADLIVDLLPPGVLNIVNGFGVESGKPLASNKRVAKVAFTGEGDNGATHYAIRLGEFDSCHAGAQRQVAEYLLRRRHGRGRRLSRQDARGLHHVRAQSGGSLHLPEPGAGAEIDL